MTKLNTLSVLILDCQATGPSPQKGDLIDIAWCSTNAQQNDLEVTQNTTEYLVALQTQTHIARRITQLTGITTQMLVQAPELEFVSKQLQQTLDANKQLRPLAHYARYERPFIASMLGQEHVEMICTHQIATRLLPDLPRRGLRPLAGYFGKLPEEVKRASDHVLATALIWRELVNMLDDVGVKTLAELSLWMEKKPRKRSKTRTLPLPRDVRLALPDTPGVYRMLSKRHEVLYVGKATSLKSRVNSYYRGRKNIAEKTLELITQVWSLDVTQVGSAFEAALLETDEIKRLDPPYNKQLKHHDRHIWFANKDDPLDLQPHPDQSHTLGPFSTTFQMEQIGVLLRTIQGKMHPQIGDLFFDLSAEDEPFAQGLDLFKAQHELTTQTTADHLFSCGQTLWQHRLEQKIALAQTDTEIENDDDEHDEDIEIEEDFEWTPEIVCSAMNHILINAYKTQTRAKWLISLLDMLITWHPTHDNASEEKRVCFRQGQLNKSLPLSPSNHIEKCLLIDVSTYDRLTVTLKEIRRIWHSQTPMTITLGADQLMDMDDIGVMLTLTASSI